CAASRAVVAIPLACRALSEFCLIIDAICSSDAEVSSNEEACSDAPAAICWLESHTWCDAAAICEAPAVRPDTMRLSRLVNPRETRIASDTDNRIEPRAIPMNVADTVRI